MGVYNVKTRILSFLQARKKAIAALLAPAIVILAAKKGMNIDVPAAQLLVLTLVTGVLSSITVHQTRNGPVPK